MRVALRFGLFPNVGNPEVMTRPLLSSECVAVAHVAKNLDIPGGYDALKAKVTGTDAVSLGKAISGLAPKADAKPEAKKANKQASDNLKENSL